MTIGKSKTYGYKMTKALMPSELSAAKTYFWLCNPLISSHVTELMNSLDLSGASYSVSAGGSSAVKDVPCMPSHESILLGSLTCMSTLSLSVFLPHRAQHCSNSPSIHINSMLNHSKELTWHEKNTSHKRRNKNVGKIPVKWSHKEYPLY